MINLKRKYVYILAIALVTMLVLYLCMRLLNANHLDFSVVAEIGGEPVVVRELEQEISMNRSEVIAYFTGRHGPVEDRNFWYEDFNGEIPVVIIKNKSLEDLVPIKVEQRLARENGIIDNTSYQVFLKKLEQENKRRREAKKRGEAVYGPVKYSEYQYYRYLYDNTLFKLKEKLAAGLIKAQKENAEKFYELNKDSLYKKSRSIKIEQLFIPYQSSDTGLKRDEAKKTIEEAQRRLERGEKFEDLVMEYNPEAMIKNGTYNRIFSEETKKYDNKENNKLLLEVQKLNAGQISEILDIETRTGEHGFYILKCLENYDGGYYAFDEIKDKVYTDLEDRTFNKFIDNFVQEAKINVNKDVFDKVRVD